MERMFGRKDRFVGSLIYGVMHLIGKLPAWWHYGVSNAIAFLLHRVVRYRRDVVQEQLKLSFPDKDETERRKIERGVYLHLSDIAVEYFMLAGFGRKELHKRLRLEGIETLRRLYGEGHRMIYINLGHYGNWEWFTGFQDFLPFTQLHVLYKPLRGVLDYVMCRLRSKFGSHLIDKNVAPRSIIGMRGSEQNELFIFVADQTPSPRNIHLFTRFLNRDTAVFTGMERLAQKTKSPVGYIDVQRVKRGYYVCRIEILTEDASQHKFGEVSALFMHRLEDTISRAPELWLWSHRRWKYGEAEVNAYNPQQEYTRL